MKLVTRKGWFIQNLWDIEAKSSPIGNIIYGSDGVFLLPQN